MHSLSKLKALWELPSTERSVTIRSAVGRRARKFLDSAICSYVAPRLNRSTSIPYSIGYKPDSHCEFSGIPCYSRLFELWTSGTATNNCGDMARFYAIYQNVDHVLSENVPGDIVELGVYKGNSAALLATLARKHERHTFLFDTFSGFDCRDLVGSDANPAVQFEDATLEAVESLVGKEAVTYIKGFFPQSTIQIEMPTEIAVAHIDCDLYQPMRAGLEVFFPRISLGGLLILHDYSSGAWPGTTRAVNEFFASRAEKPVLIPDKSGTAMVRKMRS
jgi:Macrocin-O-methyltransferase (TylF)